jgi:plastocyanin
MRRATVTMLAAAVLAACSSDGGGGVGAGSVTVGNNFFSPATVNPDANGDVTWTWSSGGTLHNVTWEDLTPGSGDQGSGTYTRDFTGAPPGGTVIRYRCSLHSVDFNAGMVGQVVIP